MANELELAQRQMNQKLNTSLVSAASIITKDYLENLEKYEIIKPSEEDKEIDIAEDGRFYKLTKLVLSNEENFLNKLTTIVNVISSIGCSMVTMIRSNGVKVDYYFGIVSKKEKGFSEADKKRREANAKAFQGTLLGNLVGSELIELSKQEVNKFKEEVLTKNGHCISAISGIVSLREKERQSAQSYVQGIENLTDSLKGQKYTIIMLADPVSSSEIQQMKQGYELLHTELSTFERSILTLNESDTASLSKARSESISEGISKGIAMTQSSTKSKGRYFGGSANIGVNFGFQAGIGIHGGVNSSNSDTRGKTTSTMESSQKSKSVTDTVSSSKASGKSLQLHYENRSVKALLDKIDRQLLRLDECEDFGAFSAATYVIAEDREASLTVASNYNALMRGEKTNLQASHINLWNKPEEIALLNQYLTSMVHPRFRDNLTGEGVIVSPTSIVSGNELAVQVGLPKKSVSGITVMKMTPFGRNIIEKTGESIPLGTLFHMGHEEGTKGNEMRVPLDLQSLAMHTFIAGSTGTGKSNVVYSMLSELREKDVRFMVIEPAKGEYKDVFGNRKDVRVLGTNSKKSEVLKINPFAFHEDIHVLEHIDRLVEIFNVCWPMYAAMPAVLKEAVEDAYLSCGWDLDESVQRDGYRIFPTFSDLEKSLIKVIERSSYDEEVKSNYKGSLLTRVKSLTNGIYGNIFCTEEIAEKDLFDANVIVDLSRIGAIDTKALIMGVLLIRLQEYRMSESKANSRLKHITVLEEAHNLLKRTSTEQTGEGSNLLGKSVEMLSNAIAEMRTYGEGFIIADQAPGLLDSSVIRNTNTKIILRTPEYHDRVLVGRAAGLNEGQIEELAKLPLGVAAVYQNDWLEAVLCKVSKYDYDSSFRYEYSEESAYKIEKRAKIELMKWMLKHLYSDESAVEFSVIEAFVKVMRGSSLLKVRIKRALEDEEKRENAWGEYQFETLAEMIFELSGCKKTDFHSLEGIHSSEEVQRILNEIRERLLGGEMSKGLALEINHCFMKRISAESSESLKQYYEWDFHIRHSIK